MEAHHNEKFCCEANFFLRNGWQIFIKLNCLVNDKVMNGLQLYVLTSLTHVYNYMRIKLQLVFKLSYPC